MATEYGSPATRAASARRMPRSSGSSKQRGYLAWQDRHDRVRLPNAGPTRNPRDPDIRGRQLERSAAAVAADMVPFTIGEQTRGSIIRPASFCGVTGFKPTTTSFRWKASSSLSRSLDTLGFFTHKPEDMLALWKSLGYPVGRDEQLTYGVPEPVPECDPEMANAFRQSVASLRRRASISSRSISSTCSRSSIRRAARWRITRVPDPMRRGWRSSVTGWISVDRAWFATA